MADVERILEMNHKRVRWADDLAAEERRAEELRRNKAIRVARLRREALIQAHWSTGVGGGVMAVLTGACISKGNALLAVSCAAGAAVFGTVGSMLSERIGGLPVWKQR